MSKSYFPAHRPEQTFLCSVNATMRQITPDPDRPHCVMMNIYNQRLFTDHETTGQVKLIYHSKYPIYVETRQGTGQGNPIYYAIHYFSKSADEIGLRYEIEADALVADDYDTGRNRFQAHNLEIITSRGIEITHNITNDTYYCVSGQIVSDPFTLRVDRPSVAGNKLTRFRPSQSFSTPSSSAITEYALTLVRINWRGDRETSERTFVADDVDYVHSGPWYEMHDRTTYYNFNNPQFASGDAWLEYCKSL